MTEDEAYQLAVRKMKINKVGIGHLQTYYQEFLKADQVTKCCLEITNFTKID